MSWHNSHNHRRPSQPRRTRNYDPDYPQASLAAQSLTQMAINAPPPSMPRMMTAGRDRLTTSNRDRINPILGDSPYTTRRWTPTLTPAENAERMRQTHQTQPARSDSPSLIPDPSPIAVSPFTGEFIPQSPYPNRMTSLEQLDATLDQANAHLRALLDISSTHGRHPPSINQTPSYTPPPPRTHDFTHENQRSKRRKVDAERYAQGLQNLRYGHYGQVEMGDLEMEMVSCDGGMFSNKLSYAAENILKNDNSVYCTKGNRCNIVLRHRGSTAFTLSELVIKAPGSMNYSHPVREGMVFITMEQDDVLNRTAQYQIQYAPTSRDRVTFNSGSPPPHHNREPQQTISISHNRDGTATARTNRSYMYNSHNENDIRMPQMPEEFTSSQPDFNIVTECSDEEENTGFPGPPVSILRRPPNRIGTLPFENQDSDWADEDMYRPAAPTDGASLTGEAMHRRIIATRNHADLSSFPATLLFNFNPNQSNSGGGGSSNSSGGDPGSASSSSLAEAWDAHASATQEAIRAVGGGALLAPHARFHIEKKKSKCTIRFDPPVSGRFILLKMWSSHHDAGSNIDIQSVIARGFAGPRYFPAVEMR